MKILRLSLYLVLCSCATNTADPSANAKARAVNAALQQAGLILGKAAVSTLFAIASQEMSGGKFDFGSAAAQGVWSSVDANTISGSIGAIVDAYSGGTLIKTAMKADQIAESNLDRGVAPPKVANAIATVLSTAAGAPPKLP